VMLDITLLKRCKKAIERGWLEVNADACTLCYFLILVAAFNRRPELCMSS